MRVTHVITRLIVGGAQENTIASVLGLKHRHGLDVDLLSGPTTGSEGSLESAFAREPGLLKIVPSLIRPVRPWTDWKCLQDLTRIFCETRPDIVHTHSGKAGILGRLAAHKAKVPLIIHSIHGPSFGTFQGRLANFIFTNAERRAGKVTDHFVTVANAMRDQYLAAGIGHPEDYTRVFSGFNSQAFAEARNNLALRGELGIGPEDFVVGKIARLFELKGHDDLFKVMPFLVKANPRLKFLLVGNGPWRQRFEDLATRSGVRDHVIFTGLVPPDAVPRYVGIMDALVHLSLREGLPRALPQAMAASKPVVAYACDGAPEVCLEGETGYAIPPGDLELLKRRLLSLSNDPETCARFGERGRRLVKENFTVEGMVDSLQELYLKLGAK